MQRHNLHERGPNFSRFQAKAAGASSEKPRAARPVCEIAGPERAPFNEIVAPYLKAIGDPRKVVRDPEARYFGGRVEGAFARASGEARLGRIGFDEWFRRSRAAA